MTSSFEYSEADRVPPEYRGVPCSDQGTPCGRCPECAEYIQSGSWDGPAPLRGQARYFSKETLEPKEHRGRWVPIWLDSPPLGEFRPGKYMNKIRVDWEFKYGPLTPGRPPRYDIYARYIGKPDRRLAFRKYIARARRLA